MDLAGKTFFITGASRGIGRAIALRAAREGANIVIAAKTESPHPRLPGTIHSVAREVEAAGGRALALVVDIRDEAMIGVAVERAVEAFGGIDICVNNASAINLGGTLVVDGRRYDLMHQINARGTYLVSRACIPYLRRADNPHVLGLCPPPQLRPEWFSRFPAYAVSKFNMSLFMTAFAAEFRSEGIAFNGLWPRAAIDTAALAMGEEGARLVARGPEIVAEAACAIFRRRARACTGRFFLDDEVLWEEGRTDFSEFRPKGDEPLSLDLFVDREGWAPPGVVVA